jgi:hypothetical protein
VDYNLCNATGLWKDLMTGRFGSDVTLRTRLSYFLLDGILDSNRHERMRIRPTKTIYNLFTFFRKGVNSVYCKAYFNNVDLRLVLGRQNGPRKLT